MPTKMLAMSSLSPNELIGAMEESLRELTRLVSVYHDQLVEDVTADNDYREVYAKTYLLVKTEADKQTVAELDAKVTDRVKDYKRKADMADAMMHATREAMDVQRKSIDVAQSALAWSRAELEHTMTQEPLFNGRTG